MSTNRQDVRTLSGFAESFAANAHMTQTRKDGSPYIVHPTRVAALVSQYKYGSHELESLLAAAFLHDTLEDTSTTYYQLVENFGHLVASIVLELTTNPEMKSGVGDKGKYLAYKCKHMTHWALVIKLCDRIDNMSDLSVCAPEWIIKYTRETETIINYLMKNRELTNTHKAILRDLVGITTNVAKKFKIKINLDILDLIEP